MFRWLIFLKPHLPDSDRQCPGESWSRAQCLYLDKFFPGPLLSIFSKGWEGNVNAFSRLFPGEKGWLWPVSSLLAPAAVSSFVPSEQKRLPSTWETEKEGQPRRRMEHVKWHLHCQLSLSILSISTARGMCLMILKRDKKMYKHLLPCHADVQYPWSSSVFAGPGYTGWLVSWFSEFTFLTTSLLVLYVDNGSQALPSLVPFFFQSYLSFLGDLSEMECEADNRNSKKNR